MAASWIRQTGFWDVGLHPCSYLLPTIILVLVEVGTLLRSKGLHEGQRGDGAMVGR